MESSILVPNKQLMPNIQVSRRCVSWLIIAPMAQRLQPLKNNMTGYQSAFCFCRWTVTPCLLCGHSSMSLGGTGMKNNKLFKAALIAAAVMGFGAISTLATKIEFNGFFYTSLDTGITAALGTANLGSPTKIVGEPAAGMPVSAYIEYSDFALDERNLFNFPLKSYPDWTTRYGSSNNGRMRGISLMIASSNIVDPLTGSYSGSAAPIPEPATMVLFGTGLAWLGRVSRRRMKK